MIRIRLASGAVVLGLVATLSLASSAHAAPSGVNYFVSAPFVQGSFVSTGTSDREDFSGFNPRETFPPGAMCPLDTAVGEITGDCNVRGQTAFGGATALDDTPTIGEPAGVDYNYLVSQSDSDAFAVQFDTPVRYLGFWWSAVSATDVVTVNLTGGGELVLDASDLGGLLGTSPISDLDGFGDSGQLSSIENDAYTKHFYYGNPRSYEDGNIDNVNPGGIDELREAYVYVHFIAVGGVSFDGFEAQGFRFEIDNIVIDTAAPKPDGSLVRWGSTVPEAENPRSQDVREAPDTAIALTPSFGVGDRACTNEVFAEGFGLRALSGQSLEFRSPLSVLASGTSSSTGTFAYSTVLPTGMSAGVHSLTLRAVGSDGVALTLVRSFTVDGDCRVLNMDNGVGFAGSTPSGLAATGESVSALGVGLASVAAAVGMVFVLIARRRLRDLS